MAPAEEDDRRPRKPAQRTPRRQRRESAVQSDLAYVLQRMREMADREERDKRYNPGFKVDPPTKKKDSE